MSESVAVPFAVLAIGSELLDGRTLEKNVNYLGRKLHELGAVVAYGMQCGDSLKDIHTALTYLVAQNTRCIFVSGGLGPTVDDRTRQAIAEFCGEELERDPAVVEELRAWFESRGRTFADSNALQAEKPAGAEWIPNAYGTAPGFYIQPSEYPEVLIVTLPGIPRELQGMFEDEVVPVLRERFSFVPVAERVLRIFGLPESTTNDRIAELNLPEAIEVVFNVDFPTITVLLRSNEISDDALEQHQRAAIDVLGEEHVFSTSLEGSFPQHVMHALLETRQTLSVAESCTGGMLGSFITSVPGVSALFEGGVISYSYQAKKTQLGVTGERLLAFGAVSSEIAADMAEGIRSNLETDFALALSGIAGPDGATETKPVGTVFIALATKERTIVKEFNYPFGRERFRKIAAFSALDMLRRLLAGTLDD